MTKKYLSKEEAVARIRHYCAYQERSHAEVRTRLLQLGLRGEDLEEVMVHLIEHDFLNEERYAIAFAGGKFRMMHWGRQKIRAALKARQVSEFCIQQALRAIPEADYRKAMQMETQKKLSSLRGLPEYQKKQKAVHYMVGRGYEADLLWKMLGEPED